MKFPFTVKLTHGSQSKPKQLRTLCRCFLLMAGDAGWPGLGTPLEAADPGPECRRAERSRAERTPNPPGPVPVKPGPCCWDTFCSSAASCLGSTPGERWPPNMSIQKVHPYRSSHACILIIQSF